MGIADGQPARFTHDSRDNSSSSGAHRGCGANPSWLRITGGKRLRTGGNRGRTRERRRSFRARPSFRQPGDLGDPRKIAVGPWLCVPTFRWVCLFEERLDGAWGRRLLGEGGEARKCGMPRSGVQFYPMSGIKRCQKATRFMPRIRVRHEVQPPTLWRERTKSSLGTSLCVEAHAWTVPVAHKGPTRGRESETLVPKLRLGNAGLEALLRVGV